MGHGFSAGHIRYLRIDSTERVKLPLYDTTAKLP